MKLPSATAPAGARLFIDGVAVPIQAVEAIRRASAGVVGVEGFRGRALGHGSKLVGAHPAVGVVGKR